MEYLSQHIESLIFTAQQPISLAEIKTCLDAAFESEFAEADLIAAIETIKKRFTDDAFAFEILEIAGGYQFLTKGAYHETVGTFLRQSTKKRLSRSAIETLSITAYKQPVTKSELEKIRGVSCDYAIQKLLEKELVVILGRSDGPGKPLLYGTSEKFMDYFGINSLGDLPKPKDFKETENSIGEAAPIEENKPTEDTAPKTEEEDTISKITIDATPDSESKPDL